MTKKSQYLPREVLAKSYAESLQQHKPTKELITHFEMIARNFNSVLSSIYTNKCDIEACIFYAVERAWSKWDKYDPERSDNLFSFFTTMIGNDMRQHHNDLWKGKKRNISIDAMFMNIDDR